MEFLKKILTPIAFILGFIYYLFKGKVPEDKGKEEFIKKEAKLEEDQALIDAKTTSDAAAYERLKRNSGLGGDEP